MLLVERPPGVTTQYHFYHDVLPSILVFFSSERRAGCHPQQLVLRVGVCVLVVYIGVTGPALTRTKCMNWRKNLLIKSPKLIFCYCIVTPVGL
jgi:hypothetical protein